MSRRSLPSVTVTSCPGCKSKNESGVRKYAVPALSSTRSVPRAFNSCSVIWRLAEAGSTVAAANSSRMRTGEEKSTDGTNGRQPSLSVSSTASSGYV